MTLASLCLTVSYTHLDVYKRQGDARQRRKALRGHPFSYGESLYGSGQRGSALICAAGGKLNVIRNSKYLISVSDTHLDVYKRQPGTQLTMRTFHTGGVAGGDSTQGLPRCV